MTLRRIVLAIAVVATAALAAAIWRFNVSPPAGQPLSGAMRSSFVRSAVEACAAQKKASPENAGATPEMISRFCDCYAESLATQVTTADLDRFTGRKPAEIQAEMRPKMDEADESCAERIDLERKPAN